jgi:hypothetical protein
MAIRPLRETAQGRGGTIAIVPYGHYFKNSADNEFTISPKTLYTRRRTWYHIEGFDHNQHLSRDCPPARFFASRPM